MNREPRVRDVRWPQGNRPAATEPCCELDEEAAGRFPQRMTHSSRSQAAGSRIVQASGCGGAWPAGVLGRVPAWRGARGSETPAIADAWRFALKRTNTRSDRGIVVSPGRGASGWWLPVRAFRSRRAGVSQNEMRSLGRAAREAFARCSPSEARGNARDVATAARANAWTEGPRPRAWGRANQSRGVRLTGRSSGRHPRGSS